MSQINPFAGAIAQTPQAAKLAAIDRDAQVHKATLKQRSTGYTSDQKVDEFVESADTVSAVGDDDQHHDPRQKKRHRPVISPSDDRDSEGSHLDITA